MRDILLDNDSMIESSSVGKEVGLTGANDVLKVGFYAIHNDFCQ